MAILGVDLGEKRVGLALSRYLVLAEPYLVLEFDKGTFSEEGFEDLVTKLRAIIRREKVESLVIGLPVLADGSLSAFAQKLKSQGEKLGMLLALPVFFEDESFTSDKGVTDDVAAQKILQGYLDSRAR